MSFEIVVVGEQTSSTLKFHWWKILSFSFPCSYNSFLSKNITWYILKNWSCYGELMEISFRPLKSGVTIQYELCWIPWYAYMRFIYSLELISVKGQNRLKRIGDDQQITLRSRDIVYWYGGSNVEFRMFPVVLESEDSSASFGVHLEDTMG